ncbi:hypothetical protein HS088_TW19G00722 [Tripterygium wilfordii]|uniref:DUF4378 domain-containing protein n=1 Tax=Tripterygium wilfordii TaxID=458696 RepID=A0A7J7CB77_TRIWF|nr:hypothetical protein HS088_TW19G00722 [Tripterygium wilfordii]
MGWASRSSKRGGGEGESGGGAEKDNGGNFSGCMNAVFQLFDFHHRQFNFGLHQQPPFLVPTTSILHEEPTAPRGIEAPRNSLDLEEESSSTIVKEEEILKIPMGHIQIRTNGETRSKASDSSSEISSSPGTKTPTLVARLMGLDLLPDCSSPTLMNPPRNKLSSAHRKSLDSNDVSGTRSLPETPRISYARRSDVDHHRFSLQLNKENNASEDNIDVSRFSYLRRREVKNEDENGSPSHYARQIVKQVKESVSRKVGLDITNIARNKEQRRDQELLSQLKCKRSSKPLTKVIEESSPGKHSTPSCSPRLSRFLEPKAIKEPTLHPQKPSISSSPKSNTEVLQPTKVAPRLKLQPVQVQKEHKHQQQQQRLTLLKCKKESEERFGPLRQKKPPQTSDIIRNKQEEPFVRPSSTAIRAIVPADKKCKITLLSNDLLHISVPNLLPVKKDPSPPASKLPQKQVSNAAQESKRSSQLSSCLSQSYTLFSRGNDQKDDISNCASATTATATTTTTGNEAEYHEYVTRILRRTGIDKDTPVSFTRWFSPSHPLDPSIFYYLEHFTANPTKLGHLHHRCNRKLVFHLVDELLVQVLKPYINTKPWVVSSVMVGDYSHMRGSQLIDTLCKKIDDFPSKDCCVLEDIDALVDEDLPLMKVRREIAFEEEGEGIVTEIEKDILDTLLHESAVEFYVGV